MAGQPFRGSQQDEGGIAMCRHRGRAAQMRAWAENGAREAEQQRQAQRCKALARARHHQKALDILKREKQLESQRCQLCDVVRAQAWGLGHSNWMDRTCSKCWAIRSEQLSLERHFGGLAAAARQIVQGTRARLPGVLLRALEAVKREEGDVDRLLRVSSPALPGRSARVTDRRTSARHHTTTAYTRPSSAGPVLSRVDQKPEAAVPENRSQEPEPPPKTDSEPEAQASPAASHASSSSGDDQYRPVASRKKSAGASPPSALPKPLDDRLLAEAVHTRDAEALVDLLGPSGLQACLDELLGCHSTPEGQDVPKHTHSEVLVLGAGGVLQAAPADGGCQTGDAHGKAPLVPGLPTSAQRQKAREKLAACVAAEAHAEMRARESSLLFRNDQAAVQDSVALLPQSEVVDTGRLGADQSPPRGVDSVEGKQEAKRRQWALEREGILLLELEKCDQELVFGVTQADRTAALFLGVQLREELAVLARANRRHKRAMEIRKHAMRNPVAQVSTGSPDQYVKKVFGRYIPPETALPPQQLSRRRPGGALPWTAAGVTAKLKKQLEAELSPQVLSWEGDSRHAKSKISAAQQRTPKEPQPSSLPATAPADQPAGQPHTPDQQWHERLYPRPAKAKSQLLMSPDELHTLQAVLQHYRNLQPPAGPAPVGMHAQLRARVHAEAEQSPGCEVRSSKAASPDAKVAPAPVPAPALPAPALPPPAPVDQLGSEISFCVEPSMPESPQRADLPVAAAGLPEIDSKTARRLVNKMRQLSAQPTHPDKLNPASQLDQVTWRPGATRSGVLPYPPGLCSVGDWDGEDAMHRLARLRGMPAEDLKVQLRRRRDWEAALKEVRLMFEQADRPAAGATQ